MTKPGLLFTVAALGLVAVAGPRVARAGYGAATPAAETPAQTPSGAPRSEAIRRNADGISYVDGQLRIEAFNTTLADVLIKIGSATGITIDIPTGATSERITAVALGPGPARQILATLLGDCNFDYLIQSFDTDPDRLQSVLLIPREKKGSAPNGSDGRSPYSRALPPPRTEDTPAVPVTESIAGPQAQNAAEASSLGPAENPIPPDQRTVAAQPYPSNQVRQAALTPPPALNQQSISQQLQQMYQQRVQMVQQDRQTGSHQ